MLKSELIRKLAEKNFHLYQQDLDRVVNIVLDEILGALREGNRVELRGFGALSVKSREPRIGRNPRTGTSIEVIAKRTPAFRCGKELRKRLNTPEP